MFFSICISCLMSVPVNDRNNVYFRKLIMTVVVIFGSIYFSTVRLLQKNLKTIVISLSYEMSFLSYEIEVHENFE